MATSHDHGALRRPANADLRMATSRPERQTLLSRELLLMVNNPDYSDICFMVEDKKVHAHKAILAARSPLFRRLFDLNKAAKEQVIKDTTHQAFLGLVEYLYTGSVLN